VSEDICAPSDLRQHEKIANTNLSKADAVNEVSQPKGRTTPSSSISAELLETLDPSDDTRDRSGLPAIAT